MILYFGSGIAPIAGDPYWDNVVFLAQGDGTLGTAVVDDNSPLVRTFTASSGVTISDTESLFSGQSLFNETAGTSIPQSSPYDTFGTDFTAELWFYQTNVPSTWLGYLGHSLSATGTGRWHIGTDTADVTKAAIWVNGSVQGASSTGLITLNTWHFAALSCIAGSADLYFDGPRVVSGISINDLATSAITFGGSGAGSNFVGYTQDVRLTKGVGRYSGASMTVPTERFPSF